MIIIVMKILFFNLDKINNHKNVSVKFNKLELDKKIKENNITAYDRRKFKNFHKYHSLVKGENKNYLFFHKSRKKGKEKTYFMESNNLDFINKKVNFLQDLGCASHNFSAFKTKENKIYAVGGKANSEETYNKKKLPNYGEEYISNFNGRRIINPDINHPYHANGIYLFEFDENENKLNLVVQKPIINLKHLIDEKYKGVASLDSHICCFYDKNISKYRIYCRANLNQGIRHIQTSVSNDLINWEKFKLINVTPSFNLKNDNYYCISCQNYLDSKYYLGVSPYFKKNNKFNKDGIYLMISENGIDWYRIGIIKDAGKKYSTTPFQGVVHKLECINNLLNIYIDFNQEKQEVLTYKIKKDRFCSLYNCSDEIGYVEFDTKLNNNEIILNFKTEKNGYLMVENKKYEGDFLDLKVNIDNSKKLKIQLFKSEIYSIIY